MKKTYAVLANRLLRSFRSTDGFDPQTYITAVTVVLMQYPLDIVDAVAGPLGLPSKQSWLPTIHEIKQACDAIYLPRMKAAAQERRIQEQLDERKLLEAPRPQRQTMEEIRAEMAARGFPMTTADRRMQREQRITSITSSNWQGVSQALQVAMSRATTGNTSISTSSAVGDGLQQGV